MPTLSHRRVAARKPRMQARPAAGPDRQRRRSRSPSFDGAASLADRVGRRAGRGEGLERGKMLSPEASRALNPPPLEFFGGPLAKNRQLAGFMQPLPANAEVGESGRPDVP